MAHPVRFTFTGVGKAVTVRSDFIVILPPVQEKPDEFTPAREFRTKFSPIRKCSKPEQRIPLLYGFACPKCDTPVVAVRDGMCVYRVNVLDMDSETVTVNVQRPHRCPGKKVTPAEQAVAE